MTSEELAPPDSSIWNANHERGVISQHLLLADRPLRLEAPPQPLNILLALCVILAVRFALPRQLALHQHEGRLRELWAHARIRPRGHQDFDHNLVPGVTRVPQRGFAVIILRVPRHARRSFGQRDHRASGRF